MTMSDNDEHPPGMNDVLRDAMSRTTEHRAHLAQRFGFAPADVEPDTDTDSDSNSDDNQ